MFLFFDVQLEKFLKSRLEFFNQTKSAVIGTQKWRLENDNISKDIFSYIKFLSV